MRTDYKILIVLLAIAVLTSLLIPQTNAVAIETPKDMEQSEMTESNFSIDYNLAIEKVVKWTFELLKQELSTPEEQPAQNESSLFGKILVEVYHTMKNN